MGELSVGGTSAGFAGAGVVEGDKGTVGAGEVGAGVTGAAGVVSGTAGIWVVVAGADGATTDGNEAEKVAGWQPEHGAAGAAGATWTAGATYGGNATVVGVGQAVGHAVGHAVGQAVGQAGAAVHTWRNVVKGTYCTCCTKLVTGCKTVVGQPVHGSHVVTGRKVVTGTEVHWARNDVCGTKLHVTGAGQAGAHTGAAATGAKYVVVARGAQHPRNQ